METPVDARGSVRVKIRSIFVSLGAIGALGVLSACNSLPTALVGGEVGTYDRPYPAELAQTDTLNVQVIRNPETRLTMTNTTARGYGPSTVWVNARFSRPIKSFEVGETIVMDLYDFRDEFGNSFRAGGFFATKQPEKVLHAQLETILDDESVLLGLIVIDQDDIVE